MYAMNDAYYQAELDKVIYKVGLYLRLSREDEGTGQSESIGNQRDYLTKYVLDRNWNLVETYIDDGFSGTNFNRPDFKRMIEDIESKKINLVITKDLSRLGRDYIETGYYIERYFPERKVRYIALNDGIDTFANNTNNDMSPFKSVINDLYAKDISKKVRTAFRTKAERGEFIGAYAPYGYKKKPDNKNAFIIDEEVAPIIKRIFDMYIAGNGYSVIAKTLNKEGITSPIQYKKQKNPNYTYGFSNHGFWGVETVRKILMNEVYIGNMVQHKVEKINYKTKKFKSIDTKYNIVVENTHEPIISKETYDLVQQIIQAKPVFKNVPNNKPHLLSGLVYCGLCGHKMTFHKGSKGICYVICSIYKRFSKCARNGVNEEKLNEAVLSRLKAMAKKYLNKTEVMNGIDVKIPDTAKNTTQDHMTAINNRLTQIQQILKGLYEDKIKGLLPEDDFRNLLNEFNREKEQLSAKISTLEKEQQKGKKMKEPTNVEELVKQILGFETIPKNVLIQLIDKIEIKESGKIEIKYKFKCPCD